jgi:6-pyruvoyltetrahydropterin/6-carboxytetrahydropterin synthase
MYSIKIQTEFSASHQLRDYNGPCSRQHGHNWKVIIEVKSAKLDKIGMSLDFYELEKKANEIIKKFDHRDINVIPPFDKDLNPTSENIARYIFEELEKQLPREIIISSVSVSETDKYTAKYSES